MLNKKKDFRIYNNNIDITNQNITKSFIDYEKQLIKKKNSIVKKKKEFIKYPNSELYIKKYNNSIHKSPRKFRELILDEEITHTKKNNSENKLKKLSYYDNTTFINIEKKNLNSKKKKNDNNISYWNFNEDLSKITRVIGDIIYQFNINSNTDVNFVENFCSLRNKNI
tara:strand:- start:2918 stop:3421 length:504 start_codon:yes stop_codon:yes gene_type:complete